VGLRGDLNARRKKFVRMAFDILDTDKSGKPLCLSAGVFVCDLALRVVISDGCCCFPHGCVVSVEIA
jgi:hypothetical protein